MEILFNYIDKGGLIFFFLFFLSVLTITIILFKFFELYLLKNLDFSKFSEILEQAPSGITINEIKENFIELAPKSKEEFITKILDVLESNKSKENIEKEIDRLTQKEFEKIQLFLPSLEIISQVSPLIGLLGTVIGMIDSFNELELGGSLVDPSILAGGIWTALLTTAMGLVVAIPALVSHYFFEKRVLYFFSSIENLFQKLSFLKK
ncbi:MAG: MotA/TolQ/ExbB proton channel family protein [Alphaproteobacteria bacterium]